MGLDHVEELLLEPLHAGRLIVEFMIMTQQMDDAMDQQAGDFPNFIIFAHPGVHHVEGDHDVSEHEGIRPGIPAVGVDLGGFGRGKGQHVRGAVLPAPLPVEPLDERVVAEDQGELTSFQAEVAQDVADYPFYRRDPGSPGQPRRTMSYGD